jgi:hypothetical protein
VEQWRRRLARATSHGDGGATAEAAIEHLVCVATRQPIQGSQAKAAKLPNKIRYICVHLMLLGGLAALWPAHNTTSHVRAVPVLYTLNYTI